MDPLQIDHRFRPLPLWSWNGEMSHRRIEETLQQFQARGFGGAFIHPRPGMTTEYLDTHWFELWRVAQAVADRLGLTVHIYDENSYPSGFAGGHVLERELSLGLRKLMCVRKGESRGEIVGTARHPNGTELSIELQPTEPSGWYAGKTYVDILAPRTTDAFLDATHRQYAQTVSVDGLLAFTDEPSVMDYSQGALPWPADIETVFRDHFGYSITDHVAELFFDRSANAPVTRYHYQEVIQSLLRSRFTAPLAKGCRELGLRLTGHLHEHEWPCPRYQPNTMLALSDFHVPGIDLLGFQFQSENSSDRMRWHINVLEAVSVAAQFGRDQVMCEAYGGGGYEMTPAEMKRLGDFLLAGGVNLIVPHMSYQTTVGGRKYDWPQTLSDHAPWWDDIGPLQEHQARVATMLSAGVRTTRVLLLHPTSSGWLTWTPDSAACGRDTELPDATRSLRERYGLEVQALADRYVDFHLGDEWILEGVGSVNDGLKVGAWTYDTVLIPACCETVRSTTLALLAEFAEAGGRVVVAAKGPNRVDGVPSARAREELKGYAEFVENLFEAPSLVTNDWTSALPPGLSVARRTVPNGELWFMANPFNDAVSAAIEFPSGSVEVINTVTGKSVVEAAPTHLTLHPGEHRLWITSDRAILAPRLQRSTSEVEVLAVTRLRPNVLPLTRCALRIGNQEVTTSTTIRQNQTLWRLQGFEGDPWEMGVQFRDRLVTMPVDSCLPFELLYSFESTVETDAQLAVERAWLYEIELNGQPLEFEDQPFFDEEMRLSRPARVKVGSNLVRLRCRRFSIHCEVAPIWILGDFAVDERGIDHPLPLATGEWHRLGLPYYPWSVRYDLRLGPVDQSARLLCPDLRGSSARLESEGQIVATWWDGLAEIVLPSLPEGRYQFVLNGHLKNLLGPHHAQGLPGPWCWMEEPDEDPGLGSAFIVPTQFGNAQLVSWFLP